MIKENFELNNNAFSGLAQSLGSNMKSEDEGCEATGAWCFQYNPTSKMLNVRVQVNPNSEPDPSKKLDVINLISNNFDSHNVMNLLMWLENIKTTMNS